MLKHLQRVFVAFKPGDAQAITARELLQRVNGANARKSNPACKVDFEISEELQQGQAYVELQFADGDKRKILTADKRVQDIQRIIDQKGAEMELRSVFKEVVPSIWQIYVDCYTMMTKQWVPASTETASTRQQEQKRSGQA